MKRPFLTILATAALVTVTGCDQDGRVARVAQEAAERQAEQNKELVRLNRETAEGTKRLVGADAETRKELASLQRDLQAAASEVGRQRDVLEADRRELDARRHRDSVVAAAIQSAALVVACVLPLVVAWYLLRSVRDEEDDPVVTEVLISELTTDRPRLLPPRDGGEVAPEGPVSHTILPGPVPHDER